MLKVKQIAEELSVTPKTVRQWIKKGLLPGYKTGRIYLIELDDYERFKKLSKVERNEEL